MTAESPGTATSPLPGALLLVEDASKNRARLTGQEGRAELVQ